MRIFTEASFNNNVKCVSGKDLATVIVLNSENFSVDGSRTSMVRQIWDGRRNHVLLNFLYSVFMICCDVLLKLLSSS